MPKSELPEEDEKPQPRIEVKKVSPKEAEKKSVPPPIPSPEEEDSSQATIIMQAPSAFEQLVDKILKKHKI